MPAGTIRPATQPRQVHASRGALLTLLFSCLLAGDAGAQAVVVVAEDGGFDQTTVRAVRAIAVERLRARDIAIIDDPRIDPARPLGGEETAVLEAVGARRLFVLRIGPRLERKVRLSFEEAETRDASPLFAVTLTATGLDEAPRVVPRLVDAVLDRSSAEASERIQTVTREEGEPFNKRPGERFWVIGIPLEPRGFSLGRWHEADRWRVGIVAEGAGEDDDDGFGFFGVEGAWLPSTRAISPYLGGGVGIVGAGGEDGTGLKLEGGVELLRHHRARLMVGVGAVMPFFQTETRKDIYPFLVVRLAL